MAFGNATHYLLSSLRCARKLQGQIPPYIGLTLPNLEGLYLGVNKFSGPILTSIVNSSGLQTLDTGLNSLSGPIPKNLGSLQNLENINLGGNFLESVLPDSIGNLSANLNQLQIGANSISGAIPKEIGNLVGLEFLDLDENMLTGCIPVSIGKFSKLKYFYAYTNRITGEIPHSLGNMTQLTILRVSYNLLEGGIPASLGNCIRLEGLDHSQNCLNGTIPKEAISLCSFSRILSFALNSLTGTLPAEVGNCKNLNILDVSSKKLHGEIPSSFENCQIPEFLGELPFFINLNLSFNSFQGKVPTTGVFDNISAFSVIGNSELCGGIKPLRLPTCQTEIAKKRKNFPRRAIIVTCIVVFLVLFLICLFTIKRRVSFSKKKEGIASPSEKKNLKLSFAELLNATDNFSLANLIGKGRYGSVYKGIQSLTIKQQLL
ncbi:putative receptor-like protein kinase At3g47110 [Hibiscus syriacus]|uniref:putative receptor-like protein kinase At3g47110 n=1 Tax=Hibiscus syriacus TaxID=106335 RepID=UPI001923B1B3|nr:putative receptor-like protein kinase At3g47110 [Hibiscus syriacus]